MKQSLFFIITAAIISFNNNLKMNLNEDNQEVNRVIYPSDNPAERVVWEQIRFRDPGTGRIPEDMRRKEMMFSKTLPVNNNFNKGNWVHRGPYNVGGRTRALSLDIRDENIMLAGGVTGGLFRSEDAGLAWVKVTKPYQLHNVTCITQDKRAGKTNIWYYGTGEASGSSASESGSHYQGNGVYKSIDGGLTWDSLSVTASNTPLE